MTSEKDAAAAQRRKAKQISATNHGFSWLEKIMPNGKKLGDCNRADLDKMIADLKRSR